MEDNKKKNTSDTGNNMLDSYKETITRSNGMIRAKYASSLLENKLVILSLKKAVKDEYGRLVVHMSTNEIRNLTGVKGNGFYDNLKSAATALASRTMFMEDRKNQSFKIINLIHSASFKGGVFSVAFTPEVNMYIEDLQENYTTLPLKTLFSFKSNHSYRLYELLAIHEYKIGRDNSPVAVEYSLSELKLELNLVNTNDPKIEKELRSAHPDYDKIVNEMCLEKSFERWADFRRYVLQHAINEINKKTTLSVDFDTIRSGQGGKIVGVVFFIKHKKPDSVITQDNIEVITAAPVDKDEQGRMILEVSEYIEDVALTQKDIIALLKAADWNVDKIKQAHDMACRQPDIRNYVGWMTECIRRGYSEPVEVMDGSSQAAENVNQLHQDIDTSKQKLAVNAWARIKSRDKYHTFIAETGLDEEILEDIYSPEECVAMYTQWVKTGTIQ